MEITRIIAITDDVVVLRGLERAATPLGATLTSFKSLSAASFDPVPTVIVADAESVEALEVVSQWKAQFPATLVAGFVSNPSRTIWERAEAAGFDLVASRGALATQLQKKLKDWQDAPGKRRVRICDIADLAGIGRDRSSGRFDDWTRGGLSLQWKSICRRRCLSSRWHATF